MAFSSFESTKFSCKLAQNFHVNCCAFVCNLYIYIYIIFFFLKHTATKERDFFLGDWFKKKKNPTITNNNLKNFQTIMLAQILCPLIFFFFFFLDKNTETLLKRREIQYILSQSSFKHIRIFLYPSYKIRNTF